MEETKSSKKLVQCGACMGAFEEAAVCPYCQTRHKEEEVKLQKFVLPSTQEHMAEGGQTVTILTRNRRNVISSGVRTGVAVGGVIGGAVIASKVLGNIKRR